MTLKLKTFACALLVCGTVSFAQAVGTAGGPSKKELIARLVQAHQSASDGLARGLLQQPIANLMNGVTQALQQVPADKREAALKAIDADIRKFIEETVPLLRDRSLKIAPEVLGKIFDERFSEEELAQLLAWLESPLSKKYAQLGGEIQKTMMERVVADSRSLIEPRLRALEQTTMKHLGLPAKQAAQPSASGPAKK